MSASQEDNLQLKIVFAVYGRNDVTALAQEMVSEKGEFDQLANDEVFERGSKSNPWPAKNKTLVVVYTCSNTYMVDIAIRGERMHFIASPPLCILGAAYGIKCVTEKVMALVKNRSFSATANDRTFEDSRSLRKKTLVVVYQYGDEAPIVATAIQGERLQFWYGSKKTAVQLRSYSNPSTLTILGAAYGPSDVTKRVQGLVDAQGGSTLSVTADNETFGNPWKGHRKNLVIVSRAQGDEPRVNAVIQPESIHLG